MPAYPWGKVQGHEPARQQKAEACQIDSVKEKTPRWGVWSRLTPIPATSWKLNFSDYKAANVPAVPTAATVVSRQEPGKYFWLTVPGPQSHALMAAPETTGTSNIVPLAPVAMACEVTRIAPVLLVSILATYFEEEAEDSQPQPPATGREAPLLVW